MKMVQLLEIGKNLKKQFYQKRNLTQKESEIAITHTANILGRTFNETIRCL